MSAALISSEVRSLETSSRPSTRSSGRPSFFSSARNISTSSLVHLTARGCGAKMTELRHFSANAPLLMGVTTGLVEGMMEATTPTGFATSIMRRSSIRLMMSQDFLSFRLSQISADLLRHFAILSCSLPIRDSSAAMGPSFSALSYTTLQMALAAASACSCVAKANAACAALDRAINSFTVMLGHLLFSILVAFQVTI